MSKNTSNWATWITIWFMPQKTIRHILKHCPDYAVLPLIALSGIFELKNILTEANSTVNTHNLPAIFGLLFGPFLAIVVVYLLAILLQMISSQIGGKAERASIRTAIAWSLVPYISFQSFMLTGHLSFSNAIVLGPTVSLSSYDCLVLASALWGLLILGHALCEIQAITFSRAVAFITLPVLCGFFLILFLPVILFIGWFHRNGGIKNANLATVSRQNKSSM